MPPPNVDRADARVAGEEGADGPGDVRPDRRRQPNLSSRGTPPAAPAPRADRGRRRRSGRRPRARSACARRQRATRAWSPTAGPPGTSRPRNSARPRCTAGTRAGLPASDSSRRAALPRTPGTQPGDGLDHHDRGGLAARRARSRRSRAPRRRGLGDALVDALVAAADSEKPVPLASARERLVEAAALRVVSSSRARARATASTARRAARASSPSPRRRRRAGRRRCGDGRSVLPRVVQATSSSRPHGPGRTVTRRARAEVLGEDREDVDPEAGAHR